jgi:hypothetical protein
LVATALTAQFAFAQAQEARPVTAADLAGKTICWDNGWRMSYAKDDSYFGARGDAHAVNPHTAQWSISEEGVVDIERPDKHWQDSMTVHPGGRFEIYQFSKRSGLRRIVGTLCPFR